MPILQTIRVNPLDLQKNIAIGISLPFSGPAGPFNSTYSTKDQVKFNLINLILTDKGERIMNPEFGCDLKRALFEATTDNIKEIITKAITSSIEIYIPEIESADIIVDTSSKETNTISVTVFYRLSISQEVDQVTVQFN